MARQKVLTVEDDLQLSTRIVELLDLAGFSVTACHSLADAEEELARELPELLLLDLNLPDGSGLDLCRSARARSANLPIIILSGQGEEVDRVVGLEIGADDYVTKPFSGAELTARVRALLRRSNLQAGALDADESSKQPQQLVVGPLKIDLSRREVTLDGGSPLAISRKEFDLLYILAKAEGAVVTREDLMAQVWDENWFGSTKTLDAHVGTLRQKLSDGGGKLSFIHTVRGVGFRFATDQELS